MLGVALLRPPEAVSERSGSLRVLPGARPISIGPNSGENVDAPAVALRQRRSRVWRTEALLAASLALPVHVWLRLCQSYADRRSFATQVIAGSAAAASRVVLHALVLGFVVLAVEVGGFARPQDALSAPINTVEGQVSSYGRLALGPRIGEVVVPDALRRPALSVTSLTPSRPRQDVISYEVQSGDTAWAVGNQFNVGTYSVLWSNGLDEDGLVKPGQVLLVPPVPGIVHKVADGDSLDTIAKKYNVDPAAIVDFNGLAPGEVLAADRLLVVPGGELPIVHRPAPVIAPAPRVSAPSTASRAAPPAAQSQAKPQAPPASGPTGRLSWPTRGVITTYFSGWHPGIDIAAPIGTPIGAADGGTVTFRGWDSTGYGNRLVISHGNGYTTTYNHLSAFLVGAGQAVSKGQIIALMGSTGNSSGPHLHFEILRNGSFVNPLSTLS